MTTQVTANNELETKKIAANLAEKAKAGDVFCLHGPMGAGKSVFARQFIRTLTQNPQEEVPSPTFTLVQTYDLENTSIWHFDLYRLDDAEEIYEIGWEEALFNNILLIEWPERLGSLKPNNAINIFIEPVSDIARTITIKE